jgi:hypothetical protein
MAKQRVSSCLTFIQELFAKRNARTYEELKFWLSLIDLLPCE